MNNEVNLYPEPIEAKYGWNAGNSEERYLADRLRYLGQSAKGHLRWAAYHAVGAAASIGIVAFPEPESVKALAMILGSLAIGRAVFEAGRAIGEYMEASALTHTLSLHYLETN